MDRADAIRLLEALFAAGMDTHVARANVWIERKGLEGLKAASCRGHQ